MKFLKRISLFLLVNIAVILLLTVVASVFKIDLYYLKPYGLDLKALLIFSAIIGFAGSFISLLLSKQMAKWMMKVKVIKEAHGAHEKKLIEVVSRIAAQLGIRMPEVGIYSSPEVNAFATGRSRNHSLVAVSSGLLQELNEDELEGVLAHEMAHIANGDMVTMTLLQGVINTFVIFLSRVVAYAVMNALGKGGREMGYFMYYIVAIVFQIIFGMIASTIVFAFSRRREFRADRGGAEFVGKAKMIAALRKLSTLTDRVDRRQSSLATMKISDKRGRFGKIFSTHPSMEERILKLEQLK
jgi:heat shock protein HtpX